MTEGANLEPCVPGKTISVDHEVPWRVEDVMAWTGMSRRYLLDLARQGVMPGRKIGGVWFFSPTKLAKFFGVEG